MVAEVLVRKLLKDSFRVVIKHDVRKSRLDTVLLGERQNHLLHVKERVPPKRANRAHCEAALRAREAARRRFELASS